MCETLAALTLDAWLDSRLQVNDVRSRGYMLDDVCRNRASNRVLWWRNRSEHIFRPSAPVAHSERIEARSCFSPCSMLNDVQQHACLLSMAGHLDGCDEPWRGGLARD